MEDNILFYTFLFWETIFHSPLFVLRERERGEREREREEREKERGERRERRERGEREKRERAVEMS
ncbi:hypothetical protein DPMN_092102 [Dreissena polymorpha]|uniref:Uncharacterized protein n=1 Tax=Dreissena polymorpha TaxID=45954 RepID=A0A9D4L1Q6_DREPO|nr:hypothetical protein DPMN_092102 [Dreissena polymorpha]